MGSFFRRLRRGFSEGFPAGLLGVFLALQVIRLAGDAGEWSRMASVLLGFPYGLLIRWMLGRLKVAPWAYPWFGAVVGPVPVALLVEAESSSDERAAVWLLTLVAGFLVGLLEWARESRARRGSQAPVDGSSD